MSLKMRFWEKIFSRNIPLRNFSLSLSATLTPQNQLSKDRNEKKKNERVYKLLLSTFCKFFFIVAHLKKNSQCEVKRKERKSYLFT